MKQIYLPNFVIALIRTPKLPPNFAQFSVPLNLNKLDLRNYLRNAYNLTPVSIRSSIRQQSVELVMEGKTRRYRRRQPEKRMTIEMKEPFVWPEEPKDLSKWDNALYKNIEKYRDSLTEISKDAGRGRLSPSAEREKLAQGVKELQAGVKGDGAVAETKEEVTDVDFNSVVSGDNSKP